MPLFKATATGLVQMTAEEEAAVLAFQAAQAAADAAYVPDRVTRQQAWLALAAAGYWATVNAAITADMTSNPTQYIDWMTAPFIERGNPMVLSWAVALNLTTAQLDALFLDAASR